jgi:16S rRNA (uracil1498-N3)-methyltransferase
MTPPLFWVPELAGDLDAGAVVDLIGAEAHHAATVKRIGVGEQVLLADGHGCLVEARAVQVSRDLLRFEVTARREVPTPDPRFTVVQALPKGDRAELAVEVLTELGADEIVPWSASRSISQWRGEAEASRSGTPGRAAKGVAKWRRTALEASKQSRRGRIPVVAELASTKAVVGRIETADLALVLDSDAELALSGLALPDKGEVLLIVGPEGGVSPVELELFAAAGAKAVRLGIEVLRTSTAGAAALAVLSVSTDRWG